MSNQLNPFATAICGAPAGCEVTDVYNRLERIKKMPVADLRLILERPDLQATVKVAAERRLRKLSRLPS